MAELKEILELVGIKGILLTLGRSLLELALIVGCVLLVRRLLKKIGPGKGPGISLGWDASEERPPREKDQTE